MRCIKCLFLLFALLWTLDASAGTGTLSPAATPPVRLNELLSGEDQTNGVFKVEQRFSLLNVTGDVLVKSGAGFLHTITCSSDTAATAGTIIFYDNTAESGTILWTWTLSAVEYSPRTLIFDGTFATGLYAGYTTTADVTCTVSYR
jgi:hypothetical protein